MWHERSSSRCLRRIMVVWLLINIYDSVVSQQHECQSNETLEEPTGTVTPPDPMEGQNYNCTWKFRNCFYGDVLEIEFKPMDPEQGAECNPKLKIGRTTNLNQTTVPIRFSTSGSGCKVDHILPDESFPPEIAFISDDRPIRKCSLTYKFHICESVQFNDLGCWKDTEDRAVPDQDEHVCGKYRTRVNAVDKCAAFARSKQYDVFAVQHGGWCATGLTARNTFQKHGPSDECSRDGKGGIWANQVYEIDAQQNYSYEYVGCFAEKKDPRSIPSVEKRFCRCCNTLKHRLARNSPPTQTAVIPLPPLLPCTPRTNSRIQTNRLESFEESYPVSQVRLLEEDDKAIYEVIRPQIPQDTMAIPQAIYATPRILCQEVAEDQVKDEIMTSQLKYENKRIVESERVEQATDIESNSLARKESCIEENEGDEVPPSSTVEMETCDAEMVANILYDKEY